MIIRNLFEEVEIGEFYSEDYYDTFGVNDERPEDNMDFLVLFKE